MPANPLQLTITPPLFIGEAKSLTVTAILATDPTSYTLEFWMRLTPQSEWEVVDSGITVSVSGSYTCAFTIPVTTTFTDELDYGMNTWQIVRTDSGPWVLASGTILVLSGG
jgi:hypothetical protein